MSQAKKIFTRMCINNWGGISSKILEFNEYVNLFSGMSGSGKSTVMDAIQVILYGSLSSNFLNKAADDAKNKRSVISYLRGEQKDGSANRANQDFYSTIVLEIEDKGTHTTTCTGVWFEVHKNETELKKYFYFSHSGKFPENSYINSNGSPYSGKELRALIEERKGLGDNTTRGEVNKIYSSNEAYIANLNENILGYIDGARFRTMQKSAIALKMTNGTGQFIRDYMFPKSEGDIIEKLSEQLGAYRDIKEKVDDVKKRIDLLSVVRDNGINLSCAKSDLELTQTKLKCIDILDAKAKLNAWENDKNDIDREIGYLNSAKEELLSARKRIENELVEVKANIKASDLGSKKIHFEDLTDKVNMLSDNLSIWENIVEGLKKWNENETAKDYVSDALLEDITSFIDNDVTLDKCADIKVKIKQEKEEIEQIWSESIHRKRKLEEELAEKKSFVDDINNNKKSYNEHIRQAKNMLEQKLNNLYSQKVRVNVFADLFDIKDEEWASAIEGRMGSLKLCLITEPQIADTAAESFKSLKQFEDVHLINSQAITKLDKKVLDGSLYEAVSSNEDYVDECLKYYLGRIIKCENVKELREVRDGVTKDCYSYSNFIFRHLRKKDYTTGACIGSKVSKAKLGQYEQEIEKLTKRLNKISDETNDMRAILDFEGLNQYDNTTLVKFATASTELNKIIKQKDELEKEIDNLENGEFKHLQERCINLEGEKRKLDEQIETNETNRISKSRIQSSIETKIKDKSEELNNLTMGYIVNEELENEVNEQVNNSSVQSYKNKLIANRAGLTQMIEEYNGQLSKARNNYIINYPTCSFTGAESTNDAYLELLNDYMKNYEPQYQVEFDKQCNTVYKTLRENIIAKIHNDIKAAQRHKNEINRMLRDTNFSDSTYQIKIEAAKNEDGQFYEMLMASELDTKNVGLNDLEGQLSFGDDQFYQKYESKIALLTDKFMPSKSDDETTIAARRKEMEKYADYRTYLHFNMFEQVTDENGNVIRENYVDDMAGRDSGGEGQNPKYVALLAGFAMLYMDQSNRESKIKLVLLDEAFSKMDQKRSEVCLKYARKLDLQLIVCVPDERLASLIRNVDCVYGFRRNKNKISMMHIDKGNYLDMIKG